MLCCLKRSGGNMRSEERDTRYKRFCYTNKIICQNRDNQNILSQQQKCLVPSTKRLVAAAKFLVVATKTLFVVPNFVAVTTPNK